MAEAMLCPKRARELPTPLQIEQNSDDCEKGSEENKLPERHTIGSFEHCGHADKDGNGSNLETDTKHRI
jgi:hypothetical protein